MTKMIAKKVRVRRMINGKWIAEARRGIWPIRWWQRVNLYGEFNNPGAKYRVELESQDQA